MRSILWLSLATLAGCTFLTSLEGLSGESDPRTAADGGLDAILDSTPDDVSDGTVRDGRAMDASPLDAASSFCSTAPANAVFCADFEGLDWLAAWSRSGSDAPGSIERSTIRAAAGVGSFRAQRARLSPSAPLSFQTVSKRFDGWPKLRVDADVYIVSPGWSAGDVNNGLFQVSNIITVNDYHQGVVFTYGSNYGNVVWLPGTTGNSKVSSALPTDRWVHFSLTSDPAASATLSFEGQTLTVSGTTLGGTPKETFVDIGLLGVNTPVPAFDVFYDNVLITPQ